MCQCFVYTLSLIIAAYEKKNIEKLEKVRVRISDARAVSFW